MLSTPVINLIYGGNLVALSLLIVSFLCDITCGHSQFFHWFCSQVGNIGGREFAESLAPDVQKLLVRARNLFVSHLSLK